MKREKSVWKRVSAWLMVFIMVCSMIAVPGKAVQAAEIDPSQIGTTSSLVTATVEQVSGNGAYHEYMLQVNNQSGQSISDWVVVISGIGVTAVSDWSSWAKVKAGYADGNLYLAPSNASEGVISAGGSFGSTTDTSYKFNYSGSADIDSSKVVVYYKEGTASTGAFDSIMNQTSTGGTTGGSSGGSATDSSTDLNLDIEYNYAKLLQYSLYFYDANMCGELEGSCSLNWRKNCHLCDKTVTYNGKTVDVSGGFHDAGDHDKFGLPGGYSAAVLGMGYYEYKDAYVQTGQQEHFKKILDYFCDYFVRCTVTDDSGNATAFCYQVGNGDSHNYWLSPENETIDRPAYFADSSNPATDQVSEAAAALAIHYLNFDNEEYLDYAKKLFAMAQRNDKAAKSTDGGGFYSSTAWEDDYCLAAAWLYKATQDSTYKSEYDKYKGSLQLYSWPSWDSVDAYAKAYGEGDTGALSTSAASMTGSATSGDNGMAWISKWGTNRYNTNVQLEGLIYDKYNNSDSFTSWAEGQMKIIMGNNSTKQCYVVGYNANASKYPHHRAASGYNGTFPTDGYQTKEQTYSLIGALVGGPESVSGYHDDSSDYYCNEVALDYNAAFTGAVAALYLKNQNDGHQSIVTANDADAPSVIKTYYSASGVVESTTEEPTTQATTTEEVTEATTTEEVTEATTTEEVTEATTTEEVTEATTTEEVTEATTTEAATEATTTEAATEATTTEAATEATTTEAATEVTTTEKATTETATTEAPVLREDEVIVDSFDESIDGWKIETQYKYATEVAYNADKKALDVTVDYSSDPSSYWLEGQISKTFDSEVSIAGKKYLGYTLIYPSALDGCYKSKIIAENVTASGSSNVFSQEATLHTACKTYDKATDLYTVLVYVPLDDAAGTTFNKLLISLVGSQTSFAGQVSIDNVELFDELPEYVAPTEGLIYLLDNFSKYKAGSNGEVNNWKPLAGWQYSAGKENSNGQEQTTIAYDAERKALEVQLDYSKDSDQSWSEAKINTWMDQAGIDISNTNQIRFDVTYPKEFDGFGVKIFANNYTVNNGAALIEAEASIKDKDKVDNGDGTITATVKVSYMKGITTPLNSICIGFVGKYTDFIGSIYVDNAEIWAVDIGVELPETSGKVTSVDISKMPTSVKMADANATDEAAAALAYLNAVVEDGKVLFGHQNDNSRTVSGGESDTKDLTGAYSGMVAYDTLAITGSELGVSMSEGLAMTVEASKKAAAEGMLISISTHLPNFVTMKAEGSTDFSKYGFESSKDVSGNCVENILPGKPCNDLYNKYLDVIVQYAKAMEGTPIIFRPLHENNGGWFWWGSSCTAESYKALFRYTVDYLQNNGVHNFIYEYSPNGPIMTEEQYLSRYPGDDYVDILGFDYYDDYAEGADKLNESFFDNVDTSCKVIKKLADERGKVAVIAEAGVRVTKASGDSNGLLEEENPITGLDWYNRLNDVAQENGIAYFMLWANFSNQNFYVPYLVDEGKSHELGPDFIKFYDSDTSVFSDGTNLKDALTKKVEVTGYTGVSGYMVDPVNFQEILEATTFTASAKNVDKLEYVIYRDSEDTNPVRVETVKDGNSGLYTAQITTDILDEIGKVEVATVVLEGDGTAIATAKYVSFGTAKAKAPSGCVDNFDYYYGDEEYLDSKYCGSNSSGGSSSMSLSKKGAKDGTYAGKFEYTLTQSGSSESYTGVGRTLEVIDYSKDSAGNTTNAFSMWVTPDGKGQKFVFQVASNGFEFEAFLTDFMKGTEPQYVTIPFTALKPKASGKVFDPTNVTQMYFYCNSIPADGEYTVESAIYIDKIKAIKADESKIADVALGKYVVSDTQLDGETDEEREEVKVTGVSIKEAVTVMEGKSISLTAAVEPEEATNDAVTWTSDDETVATVDANGKVTGVKAGTAKITVTTVDGGFTAECTVTVEEAVIVEPTTEAVTTEATTTEEKTTEIATTEGTTNEETTTEVATTEGKTTEDKTTEVVTTEGKTTEDKTTEGTTTEGITTEVSTTENATTEETPVEGVKVSGVSVDPAMVNLFIGKSQTVTATVTPATAENKEITWTSSSPDIATVDATGKITARAEGITVVKVTTADGGYTAECIVTVSKETEEVVAATALILNTDAIDINVGNYAQLTATIFPSNATDKSVVWSTSDSSIATVVNGKVVGVAKGTAVITATTGDGRVSATCSVSVKEAQAAEIAVEKVSLNTDMVELKLGENAQLTATVMPADATDKSVNWSSSDGTVINVDANGKVTAISEGVAVVTATTKDGGKTASCVVIAVKDETNQDVAVESITVAPAVLDLTEGEQRTVTATVKPADATDKTVTWSISNPQVAVIDSNGKVIAVSAGMAVITATSADGKVTGECQITVTKAPEQTVEITGISLNTTAFEMSVGNDAVLTATVTPADAENKTVLWSTSNGSVAVVTDGKVTAVGAGEATITATTSDGRFKAECKVTVTAQIPTDVAVTGVTVTPAKVTLTAGESKQLTATITPADATNQNITWTSNNQSVAEVSATGKITAKAAGTTVVIATTKDGGKTAYCIVTVEGTPETPAISVEGIELKPAEVTLTVGETKELTATVLPVNATNKNINFTSSNSSIVSVDANGKLTAVAEGKATIIAVTEDGGKTASCNVTVVKKVQPDTTVKVTGINMSTQTITLNLKKSKTLKAQVLPTNATNKTITFRSSDVKVAKVDANGKVTAVAPGVAVITATAEGNITKSVTVQVKPGKVTSVKRKVYSSGKVKLTWKKQKGVTGYEIYRYDTKTKKYKLYKKTKKNTITLKKLKSGATHKFRIKAYKKSGSTVIRGNYSNWIRIKK